jgi:hypothetical protein
MVIFGSSLLCTFQHSLKGLEAIASKNEPKIVRQNYSYFLGERVVMCFGIESTKQ